MTDNPWKLYEIRNDLKAERVHHPAARLCWCQPGHWYPEEQNLNTVINQFALSEEDIDAIVIQNMSSFDSDTAARWVRCIQNSRVTRLDTGVRPPEPEGVLPYMLIKKLKPFIDNDTTPNSGEWAHIKTIAGTVISFWANGYANQNSEKFGLDLIVAKTVLSVRDRIVDDRSAMPFENKNETYWKTLRSSVRAVSKAVVDTPPVPGRVYCIPDGGDSCC